VEKDIDHTLYAKWRKDEEEITFPLEPKKERLDGASESTFYIDEEGQLYAWGKNDQGQLGDGTTENRLSPVAVMTDKKFVQVDGDSFGTMYGIDEDGGLWSWGLRKTRPSSTSETTPPQLTPERIMPNKKFCRIESEWGFFRHFALALDVNGGLWAWGDNYYGQLGQGGESSGATDPWTDSGNDTPVRIKKDVRFVEISTNGETCGAIDEEGKLWLWGDNENGELNNIKQIFGHTMQAFYDKNGDIVFGDAIEFGNCKMLDTAKPYELDEETFTIKEAPH
jgi:alpha-tubulin suppressor-like RCC1 family protein